MARYGNKAQSSVKKAMHERKRGTLRRGKAGKGGKVTSRKQAVAIGLSEARRAGGKVPSAPVGKPSRRKRKAAAKAGAAKRTRRAATKKTGESKRTRSAAAKAGAKKRTRSTVAKAGAKKRTQRAATTRTRRTKARRTTARRASAHP